VGDLPESVTATCSVLALSRQWPSRSPSLATGFHVRDQRSVVGASRIACVCFRMHMGVGLTTAHFAVRGRTR
jgi:hypothetical protein